ncbi:MAG: hypothetical protein U1E76_27115 [Planctomycetota bacterium]
MVSGVVPIVAAGSALRSLEVLVDGISVARSRGSRIDVKFDTRRRLDGPMTVTGRRRGRGRQEHGVSVASVSVDNIAAELLPRALSRRSHHGCRARGDGRLEGPNPLARAAGQPCGRAVRAGWFAGPRPDRAARPRRRRGRIAEVRSLRVWFDRQQLMAEIATGMIDPQADVAVSVVAEQRVRWVSSR